MVVATATAAAIPCSVNHQIHSDQPAPSDTMENTNNNNADNSSSSFHQLQQQQAVNYSDANHSQSIAQQFPPRSFANKLEALEEFRGGCKRLAATNPILTPSIRQVFLFADLNASSSSSSSTSSSYYYRRRRGRGANGGGIRQKNQNSRHSKSRNNSESLFDRDWPGDSLKHCIDLCN
ncbi:MAG: hypothetical protein MHMPM18_003071 [Marteilia pararefringens]